MICTPCKSAGAELQRGTPDRKITLLHGHCPGGTWCDCQHYVGKVTYVKLEVK